MSSASISSGDYSCGGSDESIDPFDSNHPEHNLSDLERSYGRPDRRGDVTGLGPAVPLDIKQKVKAIDPCKGRCLVTNATQDSGIKYTHCLPLHLSQDSSMMRRLEWYWDLRMGELDLNTEYNIFPVSAQLSAMHEYPLKAPSWFLVPEDHIVDKFFSRTKQLNTALEPCKNGEAPSYSETWRGNLPELQEKTYQYRLVPMYIRMEGVALTHIQHPPIHRPKMSDVTTDIYPFDNLPWVTSHLDPKFVIMEAGRKISKMDSAALKWWDPLFKKWFNGRPVLRPLLLLYEAWSADIPTDASSNPGFSPPVTSGDTSSPSADLHSGEVDPTPVSDHNVWDSSAIAQWSADTSDRGIPLDPFSGADTKEDESAMQEGDDQIMNSDDDSQFDFTVGAGSRTPPRRLILSKDGRHWY